MSDHCIGHNMPVVTVKLTPALLRLFPAATGELAVGAGSVRDLLDALDARHPGMRDRLMDSTPAIRRHINIFVDGHKARLETPLAAGAVVYILTAVSGG
ncbi:MAG: MoaD/ThiS family protein [Hyphomicrobiaceae bacterium]|nr:MoaD/ThiS family protein [Hyphomicrobiaceae bacterium]